MWRGGKGQACICKGIPALQCNPCQPTTPHSLVWLWYIQTRVDGSLGPGPESSGTCTRRKGKGKGACRWLRGWGRQRQGDNAAKGKGQLPDWASRTPSRQQTCSKPAADSSRRSSAAAGASGARLPGVGVGGARLDAVVSPVCPQGAIKVGRALGALQVGDAVGMHRGCRQAGRPRRGRQAGGQVGGQKRVERRRTGGGRRGDAHRAQKCNTQPLQCNTTAPPGQRTHLGSAGCS